MEPSKPQISKYLNPLSIADFYMDFANDEFEFSEKSTIAVRILEIQDLLLQASGIKKETLKQILPRGKNSHLIKENISINLGFMMFDDKNAGILSFF